MKLTETIATLQASIAFSKKPGNEGHNLFNGKSYRPVAEVLQPSLDTLKEIEDMISNILIYAHSGTDTKNQVQCILAEIENFKNRELTLHALNNFKANLKR